MLQGKAVMVPLCFGSAAIQFEYTRSAHTYRSAAWIKHLSGVCVFAAHICSCQTGLEVTQAALGPEWAPRAAGAWALHCQGLAPAAAPRSLPAFPKSITAQQHQLTGFLYHKPGKELHCRGTINEYPPMYRSFYWLLWREEFCLEMIHQHFNAVI